MKERRLESAKWIYLAQVRAKWQGCVNTVVVNIRVP